MTLYHKVAGTPVRRQLRGRNGTSVSLPRIRTPNPPPVEPTGDTMAYTAEPLGAGGWVTGLTISPDGQTRLVRTDTLGAWRWDSTADQWKAAVTATSMPADGSAAMDSGIGVQAVAAANSAAYLGYRSSIYKSTNKGQTWTVSLANGPTTVPNVGDQRWWNTRMAFDPNDSTVLLYGTVAGGVYYTTDGGGTWTAVPAGTVPVGTAGIGIPCVAIDVSGNWYVAPFGSGVYRSTNRGTSWAKISSDAQFIVVTGMKAGPNGDLMVTAGTDTSLNVTSSRVYRYRSGTWTAITPTGTNNDRKWRTIAYDPFTAGRVLLQGDGGYERISLDYGDTWAQPFHSMASPDGDIPWLAAANNFGADFSFVTLGGLQFDPVVAGRVWMSQGIGVWYADLPALATDRIPWISQSRGIEQLVTNDVLCPPGGSPVVVSWDRSLFLVGESSSAPHMTIAPPAATPAGSGGTLLATAYRGFPAPITYAWSVVSSPSGSSGGVFGSPTSLSTAFTPDRAGTYVLRLTGTNTVGSSTTDVTFTATAAVTALSLPGTTGNYLSTPADSSLDILGDLTLVAKLSLATWTPSTEYCIIGKHGSTSKSYMLSINNTGLRLYLATNSSGSAGLVSNTGVLLPFPPGSTQWVRLVYTKAAQTAVVSTSPDGTTWSVTKSLSTTTAIGTNNLAVSTAPLTVGGAGSLPSAFLNSRVYKARVYDGATLVADFDAEGITRTGTRAPASYTGSTGKVWTPQGTGWDWA